MKQPEQQSALSYPAFRWPSVVKCACPSCKHLVPVRGEFCGECRFIQNKTRIALRAVKR